VIATQGFFAPLVDFFVGRDSISGYDSAHTLKGFTTARIRRLLIASVATISGRPGIGVS
jgi:hypothetical protein